MQFNLDEEKKSSLPKPYRILSWDVIKNLRSTPILAGEGGSEAYRKIGDRLVATCLVEDGVGVAAPQVGVFKRLFLIREFSQTENGEIVTLPSFKLFMNPKWIGLSENGKTIGDEYCLSVPGAGIPISRFNSIEASWDEFDDEGNVLSATRVFEGRFARIFAHEHDHLLGISIPQRYEMQNTKKKPKKKRKKRRKKK